MPSTPTTTKNYKYNDNGVRGVLVNLDLETAKQFRELAKRMGNNPTKLCRQLIQKFLEEHRQQ